MAPAAPGRADLRWFLAFFLGALAVYFFSPITEWGDSLHYALAIESGRADKIFESGHLLWRPLGWVLWQAARLFDPEARAFQPLRTFTILMSAVGVGLAAVFLRRRVGGLGAGFGAAAIGLGYAWWSYANGSCGYTVVTALGLAAMLLAWPEEDRPTRAPRIAAAAALQALATLFWIPGILTAPAVVLAAGLRRQGGRTHLHVPGALLAAGVGAALIAGAYASAWPVVQPARPGGFRAWMSEAPHEQPVQVSSVNLARAAYGWTRLMWQPERVALDPERKGWDQLMSARVWWEYGLWKPVAAYLVVAALLALGIGAGLRRTGVTWLLLGAWAGPSVLFALVWKGNDAERWLAAAVPLTAAALMWVLGTSRGRARAWAASALLALVPVVGGLDRFGPNGNVDHRPQMRMIREAAPHLQPGDLVYLGGELDEGQLNRTVQTMWTFQWIFFTRAGAVDIWTRPHGEAEIAGELRTASGGRMGRTFVSERLLEGIQEQALRVDGAEERRRELVLRVPRDPLRVGFEAAGVRFFEIRP
ncbi:MAG: hypothetical protein HZB25_02595 [Candidatus Eisenbacteria bacterium]|nr:hypothetical protein [Candidatus Eisenbacteria bacterium]